MAKMVGPHKAEVHKGKRRCKKCGKRHSISVHWSHEHGPHKGAHGETAWYGRKKRPQGKRKIRRPAKRKAARRHPHAAYVKGGTTFGAITTTRGKRLKRMSAAEMRRHGRAATKKTRKKGRSPAQKAATARMLAALAAKRGRKKGKTHQVRGHLAKVPGKKKQHRVKAHRAKNPKKHRSPAQKAATARMLAANRARPRSGRGRGRMVSDRVAKDIEKRTGKFGSAKYKAHMEKWRRELAEDSVRRQAAHDLTDIRGAHRPRLG